MCDIMTELWAFCGFVWLLAIGGLVWAISRAEEATYWAEDSWPFEQLLDSNDKDDDDIS